MSVIISKDQMTAVINGVRAVFVHCRDLCDACVAEDWCADCHFPAAECLIYERLDHKGGVWKEAPREWRKRHVRPFDEDAARPASEGQRP